MKHIVVIVFSLGLVLAGCGPAGPSLPGQDAQARPGVTPAGPHSPTPSMTPAASPTPSPVPGVTLTRSAGELFAPTVDFKTATPELDSAVPTLPPTSTGQPGSQATPTKTATATGTPLPLSPTATATARPATATAVASNPPGVVNSDNVNLRRGPGTAYERLGQVQTGQSVVISGRNIDATWFQICCPLGDGPASWISAEYVELDLPQGMAVSSITVAEVAPPRGPELAAAQPGDGAEAAPATGVLSTQLPPAGTFRPPGSFNPLTGLPLLAERRAQRPVVVCINNDDAARPQYGTGRADVVYEYLMEGLSITRFSAIFYGDTAERIGPIRSARLINFYLGALYDAPLFCSGGSDPVRYLLKNEATFPYLDVDLDDPANRNYSSSIGGDYRTRLQTDSEHLRRWLADWDVEGPANVRGFTFGNPPSNGTPAAHVDVPYPAATGSQVAYAYDAASGHYLRFLGGEPHLDAGTGQPLVIDNVVVQYIVHGETDIVEDSLGSTSIRQDLFGSGQAIVFRDGQAYPGRWQSELGGDLPRFFGQDGIEIPLKAGRTWISVVPPGYEIDYE